MCKKNSNTFEKRNFVQLIIIALKYVVYLVLSSAPIHEKIWF